MTVSELEEAARYEIKFTTNIAHYEYLKQWVEIHPQGFRVPYPSRRINNIYFDTYDLDSYLENMAGISSRTKLRLRWYGDINHISQPALELKIKRNKLGWKRTVKLDMDVSLDDVSLDSIKESIYEQLDDEMSNRLRQSDHPILINSYDRDYFESADGLIRVTLDRNLKFFDQRVHQSPNVIFQANAPEVVILEVKVAGKDIDKAAKLLKGFPLPSTKSSKYVIGVQCILGY